MQCTKPLIFHTAAAAAAVCRSELLFPLPYFVSKLNTGGDELCTLPGRAGRSLNGMANVDDIVK